ncbi:helix-turn-helix transcriptional regulator [Paenibacillus gansuensis]|uniref:AraC family transcriptional regulator n=1 Tax=Paenibacillus gansuensis TaxID=306542 RepID=A0ABW5PJU0_9BACL
MRYEAQWQHVFDINFANQEPLSAQFHSHAMYEIYYFQSGICNYLIGDRLITLQPGDLILMHGMTLHCANPSRSVPYVRSILHFDPVLVTGMLQEGSAKELLLPFDEMRNVHLSLTEEQRQELESMWSGLYRLFDARKGRGTFSGERFVYPFLELLHVIAQWYRQGADDRGPVSYKEEHVQKAITFLEMHFSEQITLDDVAHDLHLTKPYLSNVFKEVTGTTIMKYLYNRRINQAKMMFRLDPQLQVAEVAKSVGLTHPAHFTRLFSAVEGCSPMAYRKRMLENQGILNNTL